MLTPAQVIASAEKKWPELLRDMAAQRDVFPLRLRLGRPPTTGDFTEVRRDAAALAREARGWRIEWDAVQTRKWGQQQWPARIVFDSIDDVALALGRTRELSVVRAALQEARQKLPVIEPWMRTNAHNIAQHAPYWSDLLALCAYFDANPRPGCYPRQIPAAPDTKFIEQREAILRELLDVTLGDRVNGDATSFAERFHLREEPPHVRFRFLDDTLRLRNGWPVDDCSLPTASFAALTWSVPRVLIVENRTVFLCAPDVPNTIVIWGSGKAATLLSSCGWLRNADVVYWGDCDEAGYGILSTLRDHVPHARSVLMDIHAWSRWNRLAIPGKRDVGTTSANLTAEESAARDAVIEGPWLLEQERIPPSDADVVIRSAFETLPT